MENVSKKSCPKCGFKNNTEAKECFRCGVIFSRYEAMKQKKISKAGAEINKCKKCGSPIPKNSKDCPYCGVEIPQGPGMERFAKGIFVFIVIIASFWYFIGKEDSAPSKKPKETQEQKIERIARQEQERIQRYAKRVNLSVQRYKNAVTKYGKPPYSGESFVKYYLKDHYLKDPDSLKIEKCSPLYLGAKGWHGFVQYRAKNSFGGYEQESKRFVIRHGKIVNFQKIQD